METTKKSKTAILISGKAAGSLEEELAHLQDSGQLPHCNVALPRGYLSVSQVGMYSRCAMQYYWRYIKGIIVPPMARMVEGSTVHKALEIGHTEQKNTGKPTPLDVFLDAYHDTWTRVKGDIEDWEDESEKMIVNRDIALLTEYRQTQVEKINPIRVESRFWASFGDSNIPIVGFVDMVDMIDEKTKEACIVDYKVTAKAKSQKEADADLQLSVYSHTHATPHVRFTSLVKTKKPKISVVESQRTKQDGIWAERVFESIAKSISAGVFPVCDPSSWICCEKWCGYYNLCRGKRGK